MKLGIVAPLRSAAEKDYLRRLARGLADGGYRVCVFGIGDLPTKKAKNGWGTVELRTFRVRSPKRWAYAPGLAAALDASALDMVLSHDIRAFPATIVTRWHNKTKQPKRPFIVFQPEKITTWAKDTYSASKRWAEMIYENSHLEESACIRVETREEADAIEVYGLQNPMAILPNPNPNPASAEAWEKFNAELRAVCDWVLGKGPKPVCVEGDLREIEL